MSEILGLLQPSGYGFRGLDAGGQWAIAFAPAAGLKCHALHSGACWLRLEGMPSPVRLEAGDLVLLSGQHGFSLFTAPDVDPIDGYDFFLATPPGETALLGGGGEVSGVGGFFKFESVHAAMMLEALPPLIHIRAGATEGELIWPITRLMRELRSPQPGGTLVARHLAQTLLIEAFRLHLADGATAGVGWLYALGEPRIRSAMAAIHADPARRWRLEDLAATAGMSRTSFAVRFREILGEPAMEYLTRWRMVLAAQRLREGRQSIAVVAPAVGYESESAFGAAFKRVIGLSPRSFANAAGQL
ncbi:AraC family transcriptional regulator [Sphingomonas abietis]|uniref:AraC family transcriptional regulator n=1 Tax=Sphingomonas abietis TaxID=3012344 RepID=A0ABY7NSP8_9SPHN|nr:AraC family transcriptional regulator [Sphingomonas abietis]WBO23820.1 AraC family transcriptional regulator [Sphingomonas abietis]